MKLTTILIFLSISLSASEFTQIQPIAVENAPLKEVVIEEVVKEEEPVEEVEEIEEPAKEDDIVINTTDAVQIVELKIHFKTNRYKIPKEDMRDIEVLAEFLNANYEYSVTVYGHTDSIGSRVFNMALSKKRANSAKQALIELGVDLFRITAIGKGENSPLGNNFNKKGRAENRFIEAELISMKEVKQKTKTTEVEPAK